MKVAVLTTFMDLPVTYGLVPVVLNQLQMLVDHDVETSLFAMEGFEHTEDVKKVPEGVTVKPCVPFMHLFDYQLSTKKQEHAVGPIGEYGEPSKTNFDKQVKLIVEYLEPELVNYDVVVTHDIMFQGWFLVHNRAVRIIGKKHPKIRWIHWCHSASIPRPTNLPYPHSLRFRGMKNAVWVIPNRSMASSFAEMYNIPVDQVKTVHHVFDVQEFFGMHPFSRHLIDKHNLLDCDVLCVWPTRLDHPEGKGVKKAVWLISQISKLKTTKFLILNGGGKDPRTHKSIKLMRAEASKWGLPQENLVFSSEESEEYVQGVPRQVVRDMLLIANLFVLPARSETFSMAMVEASVTKNLCVLNCDLDVMKELGGDNVLYGGFESDHSGTKISRDYEGNPHGIFMNDAKIVVKELEGNKALMHHRNILKITNPHWVWKNQMEPLLK